MVHRKRILILESEKLLTAAVLSLLASYSEFDVVHMAASSLTNMNQINSPQLDVIVLDEALLAANISAVVKLADCHPKLRLIVFGMSNNEVQVFDKQMIKVMQFSDFLGLL